MIGMIASQFPAMHETFIAREFKSLREANIPIRIYSLKKCNDPIVHPDAESLLDITTYVAWDDPRTWVNACFKFLRHPIRALRGLLWVLRYHFWPPAELAKSLVIWVQSMALSERMTEDGVRHIHSHWATLPTTAAYLCSEWIDRPFSFTAHAWDIFVKNRSLTEKVILAEKTITCTDYNRKYLSELCPESTNKILLNYHGVDVNKFKVGMNGCPATDAANHDSKSSACILLSVGRLVEKKGFETLIDAYGLLRSDGVDFSGIIVGNGPLRKSLQKRIEANRLNDSVELRSAMPQDQLRSLYGNAFAFIMPCVVARNGDRDGIPNVLFEVMAMGLPVIVTSISGIPEAVADKRTGLMVPPQDPERLAAAIRQLMRDPSWARKLGDQGCLWIGSQFGSDVHMQQLVSHMRAIAGLIDHLTSSVDA